MLLKKISQKKNVTKNLDIYFEVDSNCDIYIELNQDTIPSLP